MSPKKPATTMIALFLLALPMTVQADDDSAYTLAAFKSEGAAISEWCVTYGLVLNGCYPAYGYFSATMTCYRGDCSLDTFSVSDSLGTIFCSAGEAATMMYVEGEGDGGCSQAWFSSGLGICDQLVWTDTVQSSTGKTFDIETRTIGACVGLEV